MAELSEIIASSYTLSQVMGNSPLPYSQDRLMKATIIKEVFKKRLKNLIEDDLTTKNLSVVDLSQWDKLSEVIDNTEIDMENKISKIPGELALPVLQELTGKIDILKVEKPENISEGLFGDDVREPNDFDKRKWLNLVDIFDTFDKVLDVAEAGVVPSQEIELTDILHPWVMVTIREALVEILVDMKAKGKSPKISLLKNRILSSLLGIERLNQEELVRLQENTIQGEEVTPSGSDLDLPSQETETQRLTNQ